MYELTRPECDACRCPRSCCSPEYCDLATQRAADFGVTLTPTGHDKLPYMVDASLFKPSAQAPAQPACRPRVQLERWLPVVGYEGLYEASNQGQIRRVGSKRALKPIRDKYPRVFLYKGGKKKNRRIHILICEAFKGPKPTPKHEVNHRDGDTQNMAASNVEWLTRSDNLKHAFKIGLKRNKIGNSHEKAKIFKITSPDGEVSYIKGLSEFCRQHSLDQGNMSNVAKGKNKHHKGWKCEYAEIGCVVPAWLRPLCTLHTCDISGWGFKADDPEGKWTESYFNLRNEIEDEEWTISKLLKQQSG